MANFTPEQIEEILAQASEMADRTALKDKYQKKLKALKKQLEKDGFEIYNCNYLVWDRR